MKKHHPDLAGDDPRMAAEKHRRATEINRAFAVLRDPAERRQYDLMRQLTGTVRPATSAPQARPAPAAQVRPQPAPTPPPAPPVEAAPVVIPSEPSSLPAPLSWLVSAYFLL